jgi:hypothetical protein
MQTKFTADVRLAEAQIFASRAGIEHINVTGMPSKITEACSVQKWSKIKQKKANIK